MTRIIAGFAGSLTLAVPASGTRPTSDRVREAIFSALDARDVLRDARVVDLYAGSGALGLEAASRGAASVVLVEKGVAAVKACRANAAKLLARGPSGLAIEVSGQAVQAFLHRDAATFEVAFIDPPYELGEIELQQDLDVLARRLTPEAVVIVERSSRSPQPRLPEGLLLDRRKDYGDTTLWWLSARAVG